ncbi:MAG: glycosyltransferase [Chloroflexi bacterium]|nr:glycosyltransferase [Chloroflexota bacterium]
MPDVSVLVTAAHEPDSIAGVLGPLSRQLPAAQLLVICPDEPTAQAALAFERVQVLRDEGRGKPAALNLGLSHTTGEIVILTDGDVRIDENAAEPLINPFEENDVGAVSGRPISVSPRDTMLGFWSHLLTDAGAHTERANRAATNDFFVCSGYLYAFRSGLVDRIPEDALAEDAVISHMIGQGGFRIAYAPEARVYVHYPATYRDWLKQKVRSAGGYAQPIIAQSPLRMRSFRHEVLHGTARALRYATSLRELLWVLLLFAARLHLWALIMWRVRVRRLPLATLWQRVESTKVYR